jgi:hypothetical protein
MRLEAQRTGGIAGLHQQVPPFETDDLKGAIGDALRQAFEETRFFELPATLPDVNRIFDGMSYSITASDGTRTHKVGWSDGASHEDGEKMGRLLRMVADAGGGFVDVPRDLAPS